MALDKARGTRVREAVIQRKINKAHALAAELRVSVAAVSRWQNGGHLSLESACALARRLDISLDWQLLSRGTMDWHRDNTITPVELQWVLSLRERPEKFRVLLAELVATVPPEGRLR